MTVNNIEVTVNTCTCKDVFTIVTTKDQSGGIYNNYSIGGQGFMAITKTYTPLHPCFCGNRWVLFSIY